MGGWRRRVMWLLAACSTTLAAADVVITPAADARGSTYAFEKERISARGFDLATLLARLLEVDARHIEAPEWMRSAKYDVQASAAGGDVRPELLQALAERFSLVWHKETRLADVWAMSLPESQRGNLRPSAGIPHGLRAQFSQLASLLAARTDGDGTAARQWLTELRRRLAPQSPADHLN